MANGENCSQDKVSATAPGGWSFAAFGKNLIVLIVMIAGFALILYALEKHENESARETYIILHLLKVCIPGPP